MYYLVHLSLSAAFALILASSSTPMELTYSWLVLVAEKLPDTYMIFAAPYWIWAAISAYFEASKRVTVGGFTGLHLLLFGTWLLVAQSNEPHAANGWFFYFLGRR